MGSGGRWASLIGSSGGCGIAKSEGWTMIWVVVGFESIHMNKRLEFFVVGTSAHFVGAVWTTSTHIEGTFPRAG